MRRLILRRLSRKSIASGVAQAQARLASGFRLRLIKLGWLRRNREERGPSFLLEGLGETFTLFYSAPFSFFLAGFFWLLLSLPLITLVPATLGLLFHFHRLSEMGRNRPAQAVRDVLQGTYRFLGRGVVLEVIYLTILTLPLSSYQYYRSIDGLFSRYLFWTETVGVLLFFVSQIHTLPLLATRRLSLSQAAKLSWQLFLERPLYSLLAALALWWPTYELAFGPWWLFPFVGPFLLLFVSRTTFRLVEGEEERSFSPTTLTTGLMGPRTPADSPHMLFMGGERDGTGKRT